MTGPEQSASTANAIKGPREPGVLTDVKIGEPSFKFVFASLVVLMLLFLIGVPIGGSRPSTSSMIIGGLAIGVVFVGVLRMRVVFLRRRVAEAVRRASGECAATIARVVIHRELASESYTTACLQFVKSLADLGKAGETILLWAKTPCSDIQPIDEPFEAKLLDESNGAYEELDAALSGDERRIESTAARMRLAREDPLGLRRIKRNIRMNGGRWAIGMYLFIIAVQAFRSWGQNQVTGEFWLWTAYLVLFLFVPFGTAWWKSQQWWVMPGGVAYRWAGLFDRKGKVHVFDRRSSVLCIYEGWRHTWVLAVADRTTSALRYATVSEVNFLLHAWLSPLTPPPAEKAVDLQ